jgi:hypothetical protein
VTLRLVAAYLRHSAIWHSFLFRPSFPWAYFIAALSFVESRYALRNFVLIFDAIIVFIYPPQELLKYPIPQHSSK